MRKRGKAMIRIPEIKLINDGKKVYLARSEYAQFALDTDESIFKALNTDFEVTLNNKKCQVRECRVSAMPYNRPWPGKQRQFEQSESAGFISFSADESVTVEVKSKKAFGKALIRPKSKNIKTETKDGTTRFTLTSPGSYVLELDDEHNVLHIFFNPLKEYEDAQNATFYFGPGMHFPGIIYLKDNDSVYIDENAIVFGSIISSGAKNVKIFGGGVIDNSCEERITEHCYENHTKGTFRIYNCENIEISDIILTNSSTWAMSMFNCKNITVDNVKIVGQWRYNTDGIDIVNSDNVSVKNCFIRSFDDTISIKAIYEYEKPVENIMIDNCVMWCGWGKNCEIGVETAGVEYKNISFTNCDLIHNSHVCMDIANGCYADLHDITFENNNVELQPEMTSVLQYEDSVPYSPETPTTVPVLIKCINTRYSVRRVWDKDIIRDPYDKAGDIHDVVYKNINIITDGKNIRPEVVIESVDPDIRFRNFTFENIFLNGKKITDFKELSTKFENADNIILK